jgi:hypothetical protein
MSKTTKSTEQKAKIYVAMYRDEFKLAEDHKLLCILCTVYVKCDIKSQVDQHRGTQRHLKYLSQIKESSISIQSQLLMPKASFGYKIAKMFLEADIPLKKLRNDSVRAFFLSIGHPLPSESFVRALVNDLYEERKIALMKKICGEKIFLVIDEAEVMNTKFCI